MKAKGAALAVISVLALMAGCKTKPAEPFVTADVVKIDVTVEAIDPRQRILMLRGPAGLASVVAGPEVRNFDQIKVGDKVEVSYVTGIAAQVNKSGTTPLSAPSTSTYRAAPGETPAAGVSQTVTTTVTIDSVDTDFNTVTFKREDGFVRVIAVQSDEAKEYIRTLRPGDRVDVTYTEALAVAVVPGS